MRAVAMALGSVMGLAAVLASTHPVGAATWPEVVEVLRPALAEHLSPGEVERLLGRPEIRAPLLETFAGWGGPDDGLRVSRGVGDALSVAVVIRARSVACVTHLRVEGVSPSPECVEVVEDQAHREARLAPDLWEPPPRPRPPRPRPPQAPDDAERAAPDGPADTVLRRTIPTAVAAPELGATVRAALVEWSDFLEGLRAPRWHDPFLPRSALAAGLALDVPDPPPPLRTSGSMAALRDPFGEARMGAKLDLSVPDLFRLDDAVVIPSPAPVAAEICTEQWETRERGAEPPALSCFRQVSHRLELERRPIHQLRPLLDQVMTFLPQTAALIGLLIRIEAEDVAASHSHYVVWAATWLEWVLAAPERLPDAMASLDHPERRFLRQRLWRWWHHPDLGPYHDLITDIYARHFLDLYPEARGQHGLPRRDFFETTWLWATAWLGEADRRPSRAVVAAYEALGPSERAILDGFVAEPMIAARYPGSTRALTAAAEVEPR